MAAVGAVDTAVVRPLMNPLIAGTRAATVAAAVTHEDGAEAAWKPCTSPAATDWRAVSIFCTAEVPVELTEVAPPTNADSALEAVVSVLTLRDQSIPPTTGTTEIDPAIDLDVVLARPRPTNVRSVLSNSFGFGGHNACLVVGRVN